MNLDAYSRRIVLGTPQSATAESLMRLHLAHRRSILFENLDIQNGLPIRLDLESLERKLVGEARGGYCFEHNTLFSAALREIGFRVTTLLARVRRGPPEAWVRTHMLLRVEVDGETWIADVGFGGTGLLSPMILRDGETSEQGGLTYSLRRDGFYWVLSLTDAATTTDLYEFTDEPHTMADVEMANHYTSTHPASVFRRTLTIQQALPDERTILRGNYLGRYHGGALAEESIERANLRETARTVFGVDIGDGPFVFER